MVSATVREVVDDALTIIGEVSGASTQAYSDDRMLNDAVRSFNLLFKKNHWEQYREWFRFQLDGVLGIINTDGLEQVLDFEDFIAVHLDAKENALPILPKKLNPYVLTSGTTAKYWTSLPVTSDYYEKRKLQFWPQLSAGYVNVLGMVYPVPAGEGWDWEDVMHLDKDMLTYGTAFMTLASDDINSNAANMTKNLMEMRFKDIMTALGDHPILISGRTGIPDQWSEVR